MKIPLEDNFNDIIGKACRGLKIDDETLARRSGLPVTTVTAVKEGNFDEDAVRKIAPVLGLGADALVAAGRRAWHPQENTPI